MTFGLDQNPARKFYEALGGQQVSTKGLTILDAHLTEVGYGWPDIRKLMDEPAPGKDDRFD